MVNLKQALLFDLNARKTKRLSLSCSLRKITDGDHRYFLKSKPQQGIGVLNLKKHSTDSK
jgi:hypothetical protein